MFSVVPSSRFKRDIKRIKSGNFNENILKVIINTLASVEQLQPKYRDHLLTGNWDGYRECHVQNDCLLIIKLKMVNYC